jgi:hypothetical protein
MGQGGLSPLFQTFQKGLDILTQNTVIVAAFQNGKSLATKVNVFEYIYLVQNSTV